jgi:hypothetical protein
MPVVIPHFDQYNFMRHVTVAAADRHESKEEMLDIVEV